MHKPTPAYVDITVDGPDSTIWSLDAERCPGLRPHRLARVGIHHALPPYQRVRTRPDGSFVMICFEGEGRVLLDGRWQSLTAGVACMAPPRVMNAFHAFTREPWSFLWVRYDEPPAAKPLITAGSPVRVRCDPEAFARVFDGLRGEWEGIKDARLLRHWIELLHAQIVRLVQPREVHEKLWTFWNEVEKRLDHAWDLTSLARAFHSSEEHLRRLCQRELGRSPMQHLTCLRLQRAQQLLEGTNDKLEAIASAIGYDSAMVFSRAFKRWIGCSPSEYRCGGTGST